MNEELERAVGECEEEVQHQTPSSLGISRLRIGDLLQLRKHGFPIIHEFMDS